MSIFYTDDYFHPNYQYSKNKPNFSKGIDSHLFFSFKNGLTLKQDFYSFPENLHFDQVRLNLCHVVHFNIYDPDKINFLELPGYNYYGTWGITLKISEDWIHYDNLCFWDQGLYNTTDDTVMTITETGFLLKKLRATDTMPNFSGKKISQLRIDFINSNLFMKVDKQDYKYPFRLNFTLKPESIPSRYLKTALEQKVISQSDYDDQSWRRNHFNFDVKLPEKN